MESVMETLPALQESQVDLLLSQAIDKQVPVETLQELLNVRERLNKESAKSAFDKALSDFQAECPTIVKTKEVRTSTGVLAYKYAPIESIVSQVKECLQKHGFSYSIQTETYEHSVKVVCKARHINGHSEESSFSVPISDKNKMMNNSQVVASALTFAKRYAFCNAFGILTGDDDTDSRVPESKSKWSKEDILKTLKLNSLDELTETQAKFIVKKLLGE